MHTKQLTVASHVEVTIRRPNGVIETVKVPNSREFGPRDFALCQANTAKAGRGDVLSYTNVTKQIAEPTEYARLAADERAYDAHVAAVYQAMDANSN